jgi:PatG C-terminal/PatG Domain
LEDNRSDQRLSGDERISGEASTTAAINSSDRGCDCGGTGECKCSRKGQCECGSTECSCGQRKGPDLKGPERTPEPEYVYAVGKLGVGFLNRTNRAFLQDVGGRLDDSSANLLNPDNVVDLCNYLSDPSKSAPSNPGYRQFVALRQNIIWTLEVDEEPLYAIQPMGAYAADTYAVLLSFLQEQVIGVTPPSSSGGERDTASSGGQEGSKVEKAEAIVVPGYIVRNATVSLYRFGKSVPVISPALAGMHNWSIKYLVAAAKDAIERAGSSLSLPSDDDMTNFAQILADQYRNFGLAPADRARNFVASHIAEPLRIFAQWMARGMVLDGIDVRPSDIRPAGTDRWDVVLRFFDPSNQLGVAVTEVPIIVDVNYVIPDIVNIGPTRRRSMRVV